MSKIFKKSIGGFNKEQVVAYIDALVEKQKSALSLEKEKYNQLLVENEKRTLERDEALSSLIEDSQEKLNLRDPDIDLSKSVTAHL